MDVNANRKARLIAAIGDPKRRGAVAEFAREYGLDPTYIRQILSDHRPMGEKAARNLESKLGMTQGELDLPIGAVPVTMGLDERLAALFLEIQDSPESEKEFLISVIERFRSPNKTPKD